MTAEPAHDVEQALHWANFAAVSFLVTTEQGRAARPAGWRQRAVGRARALVDALGLKDQQSGEIVTGLSDALAATINRQDAHTLSLIRATTGKADANWPQRGLGFVPWGVALDAVRIALTGLHLLTRALEDHANRKGRPGARPSSHAALVEFLAISFEDATNRKMTVTSAMDRGTSKDGKQAGKTLVYVTFLLKRLRARLRDRATARQISRHVGATVFKAKVAALNEITEAKTGARIRVVGGRHRKAKHH